MVLKKSGTSANAVTFLDRRRFDSILFEEHGKSGFGDRMRGIAYVLFLAHIHRAKTINYVEVRPPLPKSGKNDFPAKMADLITIDGIEFRDDRPTGSASFLRIIHDGQVGNPLKRYGFRHMHRVRPKEPAVAEAVSAIGQAGKYLAVHVRAGTDAQKGRPVGDRDVEIMLSGLQNIADQTAIRRLYLAADNRPAYEEWRKKLAIAGFDVIRNDVVFDSGKFRQTSNFDLMVDFFALAGAEQIVRLRPSEFSRFAAWIGGKRLGYNDLY